MEQLREWKVFHSNESHSAALSVDLSFALRNIGTIGLVLLSIYFGANLTSWARLAAYVHNKDQEVAEGGDGLRAPSARQTWKVNFGWD